MKSLKTGCAALILSIGGALGAQAEASDACRQRAIQTAADVVVSDGSSFQTESFFASKEHAAIRHIHENESVIAVEGPFGWSDGGGEAALGGAFLKTFALGHQYHALIMHFEEIVDVIEGDARGAYPYGGFVERLAPDAQGRPSGMRFDFPEAPPILAAFSDWREVNGAALPFHIKIDDGERTFDYRYTDVEIGGLAPLWFFETLQAPAIDAVQVYRLHRKLMAAHCLGDADLMAALSTPAPIIANRGELVETTEEEMRARFAGLFEQVFYSAYRDLAPPVIEVAESGDIGWAAVNVATEGEAVESGETFSDEWAWFMLARKMDGVWKHDGNASNRRPPRDAG